MHDFSALYPCIMTQEDIKNLRKDEVVVEDSTAASPVLPFEGPRFDFASLYPSIMVAERLQAAKAAEKLDLQAQIYYEMHTLRLAKKGRSALQIEEIFAVFREAQRRWELLSPAAKEPYIDLIKRDPKESYTLKAFFDMHTLP